MEQLNTVARSWIPYASLGLAPDRVTQPLPLRPDFPSGDESIVVRAGVMSVDNLTRAAERTFALLATFDHPHFTLVLADLSELTLARLDRCFDKPIPNPGRPPEG